MSRVVNTSLISDIQMQLHLQESLLKLDLDLCVVPYKKHILTPFKWKSKAR